MNITLQKIVPQHLISRLVGWIASSEIKPIKSAFISWAVKRYGVDLSEAENPDTAAYSSFNHFFTRALRPGIRPISGEYCSPADGEISQLGAIENGKLIQAKGIHYSLSQLLAKSDVSEYDQGSFVTIYLSPKDYHRVHSPITGHLTGARYVPGKLFSVNQNTAENVQDLFAINERLVMDFATEQGSVSVIMVGAMIVAGIQPIWRNSPYPARIENNAHDEKIKVNAGDELGRFLMGSTAIVISKKPLDFALKPGDVVKMGESLLI